MTLIIENMLTFSLLFAGIWLVKRLFRKQLSPTMHYLLWAVVILKLLVPVNLPSAISPWNLLPAQPVVRSVQLALASPAGKPLLPANNPIEVLEAASGGNGAACSPISAAQGDAVQSPAAQNDSTPAKGTDLADMFALLWFCGAAATGITLWVRYRRLGRLVRSGASKAVPPEVQKELARIRRRLGIKTPVRAVLQAALSVPAIMGFAKPVILLPEKLAFDRGNLRNALLHELSHWKRGDLFVLRLMNVLCALYWFNPLVWFGFRLVRRDMETACDSTALKILGDDKRIGYIKTVLHFAGSRQTPSTYAAMSINDGRIAMKRRVEGMYMRGRTAPRVKATAALLALVLALAGFTAACQPNPTVPPVVGKGSLQSKIVDKSASPSGSAQPAGAERVKFSEQEGKLAVNVDATLEPTGAGKLPVIKVSPRKFTQAEADNFIKVLFQGKPAYKIKDYLTKDELKKMINDLIAQKSKMKKSDKRYDGVVSAIADYESQMAAAPDQESQRLSDGQFEAMRGGDSGETIAVTTPLGKSSDAILSVINTGSGGGTTLWFSNAGPDESYINQEYNLDGKPYGVAMSLKDATALASKTVKDLGSDLQLAACALGKSRNTNENGNGEDTGKQAYLFMFTRSVDGVSSTYEQNSGGGMPQDEVDKVNSGQAQFIEPHPYERIVMAVDDSGILELQWNSPDEVKETVSENVETLPFDQVIDIAKKQFLIHNALSSGSNGSGTATEPGKMTPEEIAGGLRNDGIVNKDSIGDEKDIRSCTYTINRVVLGLSRIAVKDKPDEFMLVPVYDFFGTVKVEYTKESGIGAFVTNNANVSFLTVNAIDGSIINRSYGY